MLSGSSVRKLSGMLIAVLVLGIAVGAKIPTSRCKCHKIKPPVAASDSNPTNSDQKKKGECPFATLRGLAGSFSIVAEAVLTVPQPVEQGALFLVTYQELFAEPEHRSAQPRAPPAIA